MRRRTGEVVVLSSSAHSGRPTGVGADGSAVGQSDDGGTDGPRLASGESPTRRNEDGARYVLNVTVVSVDFLTQLRTIEYAGFVYCFVDEFQQLGR